MGEINFDWFNPKVGTPTVSIAKYGITLNESSLKKLNNPKYIKIGFDKAKNTMCIAISNKDDTKSIKVKYHFSYARINCKGLIFMLDQHKNNNFMKYTTKFFATHEKNNNYLIINLNTKNREDNKK